MIHIKTKDRPLGMTDLARLEGIMGRPLPEQYRSFLLRTNGGRPKPDSIDIEGSHFRATDVQVFHGIDTEIEADNILWNLEILEGCKENHLLPIACDSGGHLFMLILAEKDYGHVLYFDMFTMPPHPYHIANDFNEFLAKLRAPTPEELAEIDAMAVPQ